MLHDDARARSRPVELEKSFFGLLTVQCLLGPQMKRKETTCARATVFLYLSEETVDLQSSALKGQCAAASKLGSASVESGLVFLVRVAYCNG